jgi:hypothetical protein
MPNKTVNSVKSDNTAVSLHQSFPVAYTVELHRLIQIAAYELAEADAFRQSPCHYWFIAEQNIALGL